MRARSFSRVSGGRFLLRGDFWERAAKMALREVVGEGFRAFMPIPTTAIYSAEE